MIAKRWQQIERVCHDALAREPTARAKFLDDACAGDADLRREVESLIEQQSAAEGFLEMPALRPGSRLDRYEVVAHVASGGMGEVYQARDTRLGRLVAIKVLPPGLAADPERRRRFEHEARAASALNHPHICTLHDIGSDGGVDFLVMERLEGQTLSERVRQGPLPLSQALDYAAQIAEALGAAHAHGIVHRDLKPANIMLTKTGAKLLDFGLAKLKPAGPGIVTARVAPGGHHEQTTTGVVFGTRPYMAPEQLAGKQTDARTDLFAFGCVLYEMLAGRRAFVGDSDASIISSVMSSQPPQVSSLQPDTPPVVDRLIERCLQKDVADRPDSARDVAAELRGVASDLHVPLAVADPRRTGSRRSSWHHWARQGATAIATALLAWLVASHWGPRSQSSAQVVRASLSVQPAESLGSERPRDSWTPGGARTAFTWTPDGKTLVYIGWRQAASQLYARSVDKDDGRPLSGTEGALLVAVSPDGKWVAFWVDGEIRKVPLAGGPSEAMTAASSTVPTRLSWTESGDLVYDMSDGIHRAGASGQRSLTHSAAGTQHVLPSMLPGDRTLLYTSRHRSYSWGDEEVVALDVGTGTTRVLLPDAEDARYLPDGYLLFLRRGKLFAVSFDPVSAKVRGAPAAILDGVAEGLSAGNTIDITGAGQFAVSSTGALAWVPGAPVPYPENSIVAVNRRRGVARVPVPAHSYSLGVRVSPDGYLLGLGVRSLTGNVLCIYDLRRGTLTTLTNEGEVYGRTWTSDGTRLLFGANFRGHPTLEWIRPDGSEAPVTLADGDLTPTSWLARGRSLAVLDDEQIRVLDVDDRGKGVLQRPLVTAPSAQSAEFSPDGRWLAYEAPDSGGPAIFVQPYPGPGPRVQVTTRGSNPAWNPSGGELFFLDPGTGNEDCGRLMVAQVREHPTFTAGVPRPVFDNDPEKYLGGCVPARCYDVSPDGQTFYTVRYPKTVSASPVTHINLVLNWLDELKEKVPGASR